jgi:putative MATE family efflux protein
LAKEQAADTSGPGSTEKRDWTKGNITNNLFSLAWPMTISSMLMIIGPIIDRIWIGRLGSASIAGVGVSVIIVMLIDSLIMGLFTGLRAMVARFVGAGDEKSANRVSQQAFVVGVGLSIVIAVIGLFLAEQILRIWKLEPDVVSEGAAYMRIQLVGIITMSLPMAAQSIMQASGDARTPMKISIFTRVFHVILAPFMIFGWSVFPRLGVSGAALTDIIVQCAGGSIALWVLFSGRTRLRLTLKHFRFDGNMIWRIVKIGIPSSLGGIHMSIGSIIFMWFISPFGTDAVAGHTIVSSVDQFVLMPAMGLGAAAGILSAQNLGANQPERAEKTAWIAIGWFTSLMAIFSVVIYLLATPVIKIFNSEPGLVNMASNFLRIQIISYMFNGFMMVLMNVLNNAGDTLISMIVDIVTMWGIRVPLAIFLPHVGNLGVYGIRWALVADTVSSAFVFLGYFQTGRWKHKKV